MAWTAAGAGGSRAEGARAVSQTTSARRMTATEGSSVFGEVLALRQLAEGGGEPLSLSLAHAERVTRALRGALLHFATDPPPAVLSGHEPDGRRLERPHAAFVALPAAGSGASPGTVGGVAIAMPSKVDEEDRQAILLAAAQWEQSGGRLLLGRLGAMRLARVADPEGERALGLGSLTGPSRRWALISPVALQRGDLGASDPAAAARAREVATETVARACEHAGLTRPAGVRVRASRQHRASCPTRGTVFKRVYGHVALRFDEAVAGPVVIGAGRYFGVGVCGAVASDSRGPLCDAERRR